MLKRKQWIYIFGLLFQTTVFADQSVTMHFTVPQGVGKEVGTVKISETRYGLLFTPDLKGLTPGIHGFHIHEKASCNQNGMAAGGHLDPKKTGKHRGPYSDVGHLGDLPALYVTNDGTVTLPVGAPRIKHIAEIKNHALMVHTGGDNYADQPEKLGGGGSRIVCGVVR